ncbi:ABC transporter permease [Roseateles sp. BYS96W]|uniref:FtsX-like permease family protein n=1 Tax=Pelomonas nitida TaxID=3299027 RepID=A0ABW7GAX8_9BURK
MPSLTPLKFAWRQLRADPAQSALVVVGLALGLALCLVAGAFVRGLVWADADAPAPEQLIGFEFRVREPGGRYSEWWDEVPGGALQAALVQAGAPLLASSKQMTTMLVLRADESGAPHRARLPTSLVDPAIVGLFGMRPLRGDLAAALARPEGLVLTVAGAEKLFGTQDVIGRQVSASLLVVDGKEDAVRLTVMALLPDPAVDGVLGDYQALAGFGSAPARTLLEEEGSSWTMTSGKLFARLAPGADADRLTALAQQLLQRQPLPEGMPLPDLLKDGAWWGNLRAMPLTQRALHGAGSPARRLQVFGVVAAAAAVLALAVINFVNLWSVRTLVRQREIGLRKSLGAGAAALAGQFFFEALAVVGLAVGLALLLAWWGSPAFEALMQHRLDVSPLAPEALLAVVALGVVIAALCALPLAAIAMRVSAQASLAGRQHSEGRAARWLRRALTVTQFAGAALLAALAIVVLWQHQHLARLPRGIDVNDRLAFDLPFGSPPARASLLLRQIQAWTEVVQASASSDVPGRAFRQTMSDYTGPDGRRVTLRGGDQISPGYFTLYGVPLLAGRLSADHVAEQGGQAIVLDRAAVARLGFANPQAAVGQVLARPPGGGAPQTIVAVVENVRLEGVRDAAAPHVFQPRVEVGRGVIGVHSRDPARTRERLAAALREAYPDDPPPVLALREQLGRQVESEARIGQLTGFVGLVALGLAAVGLYALAAYSLRLREREIVLRKLHGAGPGAVARLLATEFCGVLVAACVFALPLAAWLAEHYLAGFAERAPMGPFSLWALGAAVALLAVVTALAVARHLRAALALRPLQALRG